MGKVYISKVILNKLVLLVRAKHFRANVFDVRCLIDGQNQGTIELCWQTMSYECCANRVTALCR